MDRLFLNASISNTSNSNIEARIREDMSSPLIAQPEKYDVSVSRLVCPSSEIQTYRISDMTDYEIKIVLNYLNDSGGNSNVGTATLRNHETSLTYGSHPMYDENSLLENINRATCEAYYNMLRAFCTTSPNYLQTTETTMSLSQASPTSTFSGSATTNSRLLGVVLTMTETGTFDEEPFRLYLTAPDGVTKCLIHSGYRIEQNGTTNGRYVISDYAHRSIQSGYIAGFPNGTSGSLKYFLPAESFLKFMDVTSLNAEWSLECVSTKPSLFSQQITCSLEVFSHSDTSLPNIPPAFHFDENTDKLVLDYQYCYQQHGVRLGFKPKLANLLDFGKQNMVDDVAESYVYLTLETLTLPTDLDTIISFTQYISTKYLFSNLERIQLSSSGFAVDSDVLLNNESESALTDFAIDYSQDLDVLTFSAIAEPFKRYKLKTTTPISKFDLSVWARYKDGERLLINLAPGSELQIILMFTRDI